MRLIVDEARRKICAHREREVNGEDFEMKGMFRRCVERNVESVRVRKREVSGSLHVPVATVWILSRIEGNIHRYVFKIGMSYVSDASKGCGFV